MITRLLATFLIVSAIAMQCGPIAAQTPPAPSEAADYTGLHAAAHTGNLDDLRAMIVAGADLEVRDGWGRTALHVAAYRSDEAAVVALAEAGADMNALDRQAYDIVTIAAVADDPEMGHLALSLGADPKTITSPYEGTALIAAAHLGHHQVVKILVSSGAPVDHVNNLNWTALIEAVVLGDGGPDHQRTVKALLEGGADPLIGDAQGVTPLRHARQRGYRRMEGLIVKAGSR
jgi:ankyrin repeat protein